MIEHFFKPLLSSGLFLGLGLTGPNVSAQESSDCAHLLLAKKNEVHGTTRTGQDLQQTFKLIL